MHPDSAKTKTLSVSGIWSGDRPHGGAKGVWLKKASFGSLFRKMSLESLPNSPTQSMDLCGVSRKIKWKWEREELGQSMHEGKIVAVERKPTKGILGDIRG